VFNALHILHNSQIAVAGINTSKLSQESNMWIAKLNADGTMVQLSTQTSTLYEELIKVFEPEISKKQLSIKKDLSIELLATNLLFKTGEYTLTKEQKNFLDTFSYKLLKVLKKYQQSIDTLEVNGHTSSEWGDKSFSETYLSNEKLSMNRSYATLAYIFKRQNKQTQIFLSDILKGSGLSYSKKILLNKKEDKEKSRRVSFKILLKKR